MNFSLLIYWAVEHRHYNTEFIIIIILITLYFFYPSILDKDYVYLLEITSQAKI